MIEKVFLCPLPCASPARKELFASIVDGEVDGPRRQVAKDGRTQTSVEPADSITAVDCAKST